MGVVTNDLVEQVLSAANPAERPLRRQMLDLLLAPSQPARMSYEEFLDGLDEDILDPQTRRAEFYQLDPAGAYHLTAPDKEGIYRSAVLPGFWLQASWLWQQPLPRVLDVLRELGVV